MTEINVLYCGMANDIMLPLLLVPDLDNLFVLDLFDEAYSWDGTYASQQDDIVNTLKLGNDSKSHTRFIMNKYKYEKQTNFDPVINTKISDVHYLNGKSKILEDVRDGIVWTLKFIYLGKLRTMISYQRNFIKKVWPKEFINIKYLFVVGAYSFDSFVEDKKPKKFIKMLQTRMTTKFYFYALTFNHKFKHHYIVKHGGERTGSEIAMIEINKNDDLDDLFSNYYIKNISKIDVTDVETGKKYDVKFTPMKTIKLK